MEIKEMTDKNLIKINDRWNGLRYVSDYRQFLVKDYWQTPEEFFINGAGDCEDFAIAKFFDLLEMNYDPWIVYCIEKRSKEAHSVCIVDRVILDITGLYDMNIREYSHIECVFGFNMNEYKIFVDYSPYGNDLGVHRLGKWMNLLNRMYI